MKNNKKSLKLTAIGFTLVELLAVIVILAIILAIAIPNVINIINISKQQAFDRQKELIIDAAKKYVFQNIDSLTWIGSTTEVSLITLQNASLLPNPLPDPRGGVFNNNITTGTKVTITRSGQSYSYAIIVVSGNDSTPPVITLTGPSTITIPQNSTYVDQGATATDNIDGNITARMSIANNVNTAVIGTYTVTFNVNDNAGNSATQVTRTLNVIHAIYTFTNAGQIGTTGPSQSQINTAYTGTSLAGRVTVTGGIQLWSVPVTGVYRIEAWGAGGGGTFIFAHPGRGARMRGDFLLSAGTGLNIVVGQQGQLRVGGNHNGGGGGGSFVYTGSRGGSGLLIAAGGGGGRESTGEQAGIDASVATSSTGNNVGHGGGGGESDFGEGGPYPSGAGGTGWLSNGWNGHTSHGGLFPNGGIGEGDANGGFGGGGGSANGGGGGGGYSGGNGGHACRLVPGDEVVCGLGFGGGSFNTGTNQFNSAGIRSGHGQVIITFIQ